MPTRDLRPRSPARGPRRDPRAPRSRTTAARGRPARRPRSPPTDWCVIACGTSISDSTPPSDSASENTLRRATTIRDRVRMPERDHPARARASARRRRRRRPRATPTTTRAFSVCAAIRRCSVRSPRCTRKQSSGPGTAPTEFCTKRTASCSAGSRTIDRAADGVRVPAEVLGRRVHDGVGAELQRPLVDRRRERVVDRDERAARARDRRPATSTTFSVGLVGVSTQISFVVGAHRRRDRVEVGLVDHRVLEAPAREHLVDEPVGAAVEVVGDHDVVAGGADRGDQRVLGGHAATRTRDAEPALELAERRAPARRASGWPSASSRSPRRTRPARVCT